MNHELTWSEEGHPHTRVWISESDFSVPKRVSLADDALKAQTFYQMASEGSAFVWRGDFQNGKQLLHAVKRRVEKNSKAPAPALSPADLFHRHRQAQAHRAQLLARLLLEVDEDFGLSLRRAPDVRAPIAEVLSPQTKPFLLSLRELLGFIGAHEWRKQGVLVPALSAKIHPHYGLFSPVRGEYLELIAQAPLPKKILRAFDIGTGTGVIAALLAQRGVEQVVASDTDSRALACAQENISRLGFADRVAIERADLFPAGRADLIVCNPPWLPARPTSRLESAIYDEDSRMLKGFLAGVAEHLSSDGEAWLILSDLAEHLGLRETSALPTWIQAGGLQVLDSVAVRPRHGKANDPTDPLFFARSKEVTRLWRLKAP